VARRQLAAARFGLCGKGRVDERFAMQLQVVPRLRNLNVIDKLCDYARGNFLNFSRGSPGRRRDPRSSRCHEDAHCCSKFRFFGRFIGILCHHFGSDRIGLIRESNFRTRQRV
jgi:hypothetical protein